MSDRYRIYLDVCCLNRPFDRWQQERIRLEGEAVLSILERVCRGEWQLIASDAIASELAKMQNLEKLQMIQPFLTFASTFVEIDDTINSRSQALENLGFGLYDAFHIACAEVVRADVLLTTDDRLLRRANRDTVCLQISVQNPVVWLMQVFQSEGERSP